MIWWYVARASGVVALLLSGLSITWGLVLAGRIGRGRPKPGWLLAVHRFTAALTVTFTGVHLSGLVLDDYVEFGWREILVPFASTWRPGAVALGVVAFYLLLAVQASSLMIKRLPRRLWRVIHLGSYGLFWAGMAHGATAGTDAAHQLYLLATAGSIVVILFLTLHRILSARAFRRSGAAVAIL